MYNNYFHLAHAFCVIFLVWPRPQPWPHASTALLTSVALRAELDISFFSKVGYTNAQCTVHIPWQLHSAIPVHRFPTSWWNPSSEAAEAEKCTTVLNLPEFRNHCTEQFPATNYHARCKTFTLHLSKKCNEYQFDAIKWEASTKHTKQKWNKHTLAETWSEVWGNEVGALAPKNFFCRPLQNVKFWGTAGDSLYSRILIFNPWILCMYYGY